MIGCRACGLERKDDEKDLITLKQGKIMQTTDIIKDKACIGHYKVSGQYTSYCWHLYLVFHILLICIHSSWNNTMAYYSAVHDTKVCTLYFAIICKAMYRKWNILYNESITEQIPFNLGSKYDTEGRTLVHWI